MVSRRDVLSGAISIGALGGLAGCLWSTESDSSLSLHFEPVPREELGQQRVVDAGDLEPWPRAVFEAGRANGTTVYGRTPLDTATVLRQNGTYYAISVRRDGSGRVTRPVLSAMEVSAADGTVGNRTTLSDSDGRTLRCAVSTQERDGKPPCVIHAGNQSSFWPELRFRYLPRGDEGYYRLDASERTVSLDRHRYAFEVVATNRTDLAEYVASERLAIDFAGADLSAEQREILRTAAEEGVYRESPPPYTRAFRALVDRVEDAMETVENDEIYVRYDGRYYVASVQQTWDG